MHPNITGKATRRLPYLIKKPPYVTKDDGLRFILTATTKRYRRVIPVSISLCYFLSGNQVGVKIKVMNASEVKGIIIPLEPRSPRIFYCCKG